MFRILSIVLLLAGLVLWALERTGTLSLGVSPTIYLGAAAVVIIGVVLTRIPSD